MNLPSLDQVSWPVRTSRLRLRRAQLEDAPALFAYRSDERIAHWLSRVQSDPDVWEQQWRSRVPTTVIVEHDGEIIGDVRLLVGDAYAQFEVDDAATGVQAELMWAFHSSAGGQGFATEAIAAVIRIAFEDLGLRRVVAVCYADNKRSWQLMERVGMRREGHSIRSTLHRDGTWCDFLFYALLAPDE